MAPLTRAMKRKASEKTPVNPNDSGEINPSEKSEVVPESETTETVISKLNKLISDKDCEIAHLRSLLEKMKKELVKSNRSKAETKVGRWTGESKKLEADKLRGTPMFNVMSEECRKGINDSQGKSAIISVEGKTGGDTLNTLQKGTLSDEHIVPIDGLPDDEWVDKEKEMLMANVSPGDDTLGRSCSKEISSPIRMDRGLVEPQIVGETANMMADMVDGTVLKIRKEIDRSKSVIVFGLGEIHERNYQKRVSNERDSLSNLFQGLGFDQGHSLVAKHMRLGKYKGHVGKIRPLKLILGSPKIKQELLRKAPTLRFKEDHHNVFIRRDMSIDERKGARRYGRKKTLNELRAGGQNGGFFQMATKPKDTCRLDPWIGPAG